MKHSELVRAVAVKLALEGELVCELKLPKEQMFAVLEAAKATMAFDEVLSSSEDLRKINESLNRKRAAASRFEKVFGIRWSA